jgi:hypothetical protein
MAEVQSPLGMDDEEFLKQDLSQLEEALIKQEAAQEETDQIDTSEEEQTSEEVASEDEEVTLDEVEPNEEAEAPESTTEESEEEISEDEVTDLEESVPLEDETLEDAKEPESEDTDVTDNTETVVKEDTQETAGVDFEDAYKRIMSPFKASKRMMQVDNIDDAISLMQKGADYHNKMKTLSPNLKMINMLEKEGLLSQEKLNNLIDLAKRDPKAIAQLIKDSGIDPLDIDNDVDVNYKPNNYGVSDKEFAINQVIDDIKDTPSFEKTISILQKEWDVESRKTVSENPTIISIINEHVFNGVYDKVISVVDRERALGRLINIPDVEAYRMVAEDLQQKGTLSTEIENKTSINASVPKTKAKDAAEIQQKRKAAAATKKTTSKAKSGPKSFLNMSDEEFMKLADV